MLERVFCFPIRLSGGTQAVKTRMSTWTTTSKNIEKKNMVGRNLSTTPKFNDLPRVLSWYNTLSRIRFDHFSLLPSRLHAGKIRETTPPLYRLQQSPLGQKASVLVKTYFMGTIDGDAQAPRKNTLTSQPSSRVTLDAMELSAAAISSYVSHASCASLEFAPNSFVAARAAASASCETPETKTRQGYRR